MVEDSKEESLVTSLAEILETLTGPAGLTESLGVLLERFEPHLQYAQASVWVIAPNQIDLYLMMERGSDESAVAPEGRDLASPRSPFHQMWMSRAPLLLSDIHSDESLDWNRSAIDLRSWLGLPLISQERVWGFLTIAHTDPAYFLPERLALAGLMGQQAALILEVLERRETEKRRERVWEDLLSGAATKERGFKAAKREDLLEEGLQTLAGAVYQADLLELLLRRQSYLRATVELRKLHENLKLCLERLQTQL